MPVPLEVLRPGDLVFGEALLKGRQSALALGLIQAHADEFDTAIPVCLVDSLLLWHLCLAWATPGGPEDHHDDLAFQLSLQRYRLTAHDVIERKFEWLANTLDLDHSPRGELAVRGVA